MDGSNFFIGLILAAILAFIPASIAKSKGRSFGAWYVYGFLLWIVAIIHAAALPYPQNIISQTQPQQAPLRDVSQTSPNQIVNAPRKVTLSQDMNTNYDINLPIDVLWYTIQKNEMSNIIYLEIKLISFFNSPIEALKFDIHCFDAFGDPVGKSNIYHALLQDLNIIPHEETLLNFIELHGFENTRSVKIDVTQVLLRSGIRNNTESRSVPAGQKWTGQDLENSKFLFGENAVYKPEETEYGWNCTCGRPNSNSKVQCIRCQTKREDALKITSFRLKQLVIENEEKKLRAQNDYAQRDAERKRIVQENAEKDRTQCEEDATKRRKRIRRNVKIATVASIVAALCVATFIIVTSMIIPGLKYNSAKTLMANGDYEEAIIKFVDLGEYKDSSDQLVESKYLSAVDLLANKQYDEASALFAELGDYKDSKLLSNQVMYDKGNQLFADGDYQDAVTAYNQTNNFQDAQAKVILSQQYIAYIETQDLLANGKTEEALKILLTLDQIPDQETSVEQAENKIYSDAISLIGESKYIDAIDKFNNISNYKDSSQKIQECQANAYDQAVSLIANNSYSQANNIFMDLGSYKESENYVLYTQALLLYISDNESSDALAIFKKLGTFLDSSNYVDIIDWGKTFEGTWVSKNPDIDGYYTIYVINNYYVTFYINSENYSTSKYASIEAYVSDSTADSVLDYVLHKLEDGTIAFYTDHYDYDRYQATLSSDGKTLTLQDLAMPDWQPEAYRKIG